MGRAYARCRRGGNGGPPLAIAAPPDLWPRLYPDRPEYTLLDEYEAAAHDLGLTPFEWQLIAAEYLMATDANGYWQYSEVGIVVARQNGKTELLLPRIVHGLLEGERIIHTAQIRTLPRETFMRIGRHFDAHYPDEVETFRVANGQEQLALSNGGRYTIVAAQRGARGMSADTLIIDELREFEDFDLISAAAPTLTASPNPQVIYLSNAGHEGSVVLNDLRRRGTEEDHPQLAYLEWSAHPDRAVDDEEGWQEANPSPIAMRLMRGNYERLPRPVFETEHLCRWVVTLAPRLVPSDHHWQAARRPVEVPSKPAAGISVDPSGSRASAAIAWPQSDGTIALEVVADVTGTPIDLDRFGADLHKLLAALKVTAIGYDPWTDLHLARHLPGAKPLQGREFANASERFARTVESGRLAWARADEVTADLPYTIRKAHDIGAWHAAKASEDRPITAALAAVRAVWLAAAPRKPAPRVF